jgi:DNA polymerase-3 subunit beta
MIGEHPLGPLPGDNLPDVGTSWQDALPRSGPLFSIEGHIVKFRVERDVLADAVAWAARSLPIRPSAPVLAGLLIEASDEGLMLSSFDYETSARATLSADVSDEGKALVSGRLLADICRSLPAKPVEMVLEGPRVSLTCGAARFSLQTMPVEDYPSLPDMPAATGTVGSDVFAHAVAQAVTAAGRDDMLPVLTGVRVEIDGSTMSLLATDRFRLSQREVAWNPITPDDTVAALVPARVLGDTAKSLTSGSEVTIALSATGSGEGIIGFEGVGPGGVRRTTTRLLDGEFPKVRSLFPNEHLTIAKVDKQALVDSVKRVALVAERNTAVQLAFSDGTLTLDAGSGDEAQASESIEAEIDGDDITTGFNPQFLLDGLTAIDQDVVELAFTQAAKPVVITGSAGESGEDPGFRYLLMPRRLLS